MNVCVAKGVQLKSQLMLNKMTQKDPTNLLKHFKFRTHSNA